MSKFTEDINRKFNLKRILIIVSIIIIIIIGIVVGTTVLGRPYDKTKNTYTKVSIAQEDSTSDIAGKLKKAGIIDDETRFIGLSKFLFKDGKYKPGTYLLSPCMDFNSIASTLIKGVSIKSGIIIHPGFTVDQTFTALDQSGVVKKKELEDVLKNVDFSSFKFIDNSIDKSKQLEGFLLPDKYNFGSNANAMMVITTMLDNFDNNYTDEFIARTEELGMSIRDIVIIASIIESTTSIEKEKPIISAVIHNKINLGMKFKGGYPEQPLCSPSVDSIRAALYPEDNEYIYYISSYKLNGTHEFASSEEEYAILQNKYKEAKKAAEENEQQ